jgi:hypothetical protein
MVFAPRGQGYYDAFIQQPDSAILSAAVGPVTAVSGAGRESIPARLPASTTAGEFMFTRPGITFGVQNAGDQIDVSRDNSTMILLNPGASGDVVGWICHPVVSSPGTMTIMTTPITVPQFQDFGPTVSIGMRPPNSHSGHPQHLDRAGDATASAYAHTPTDGVGPAGRVENIPLRLSMQIRNTTAALDVGGMVRVLRYNGGLSLVASEDRGVGGVPLSHAGATNTTPPPISGQVDLEQYQLLKDMVRKATRTRHLSGSELCTPFQSNNYPADAMRSMSFESTRDFELAMREPSYNTTIILIDDFESTSGKNNSYEVNLAAQRAARFAPGTAMHSLARTLRSNPQHHSNQSYTEASKPGGTFLDSIYAGMDKVGGAMKGGYDLAMAHPELVSFGTEGLKAMARAKGLKF